MNYEQALSAAHCLADAGHEHIVITTTDFRGDVCTVSSTARSCRRPLRRSTSRPGHWVATRTSFTFVEYEDALAAPIAEPSEIGVIVLNTGRPLS